MKNHTKNYTISRIALQRLFDYVDDERLEWLLRKTAEEMGINKESLKKELDL
jgi:hypothetical protein